MVYKFKKSWDDGAFAIKMTQIGFMEKLAALVPRPKVHLTRYHGCLALHYKFRKQIIPQKKPIPEKITFANIDKKIRKSYEMRMLAYKAYLKVLKDVTPEKIPSVQKIFMQSEKIAQEATKDTMVLLKTAR